MKSIIPWIHSWRTRTGLLSHDLIKDLIKERTWVFYSRSRSKQGSVRIRNSQLIQGTRLRTSARIIPQCPNPCTWHIVLQSALAKYCIHIRDTRSRDRILFHITSSRHEYSNWIKVYAIPDHKWHMYSPGNSLALPETDMTSAFALCTIQCLFNLLFVWYRNMARKKFRWVNSIRKEEILFSIWTLYCMRPRRSHYYSEILTWYWDREHIFSIEVGCLYGDFITIAFLDGTDRDLFIR